MTSSEVKRTHTVPWLLTRPFNGRAQSFRQTALAELDILLRKNEAGPLLNNMHKSKSKMD